MNKKHLSNEEEAALARYDGGESISQISHDTGIPRSTIYAWMKKRREQSDGKLPTVQEFHNLKNRAKRLEGIIEILKKAGCTPSDPLEVKIDALESLHGQYSVHMLCEALDVPRGTFYNHILRNKRTHTWYAKRREEFREVIQRIYDDSHQIFGSAKIAAVMKEQGYKISPETVREIMRDMGLISIRQDAKDMYDKEKRRFKNYLNQQFHTTRPNEVWVSDVTYFHLNGKKFYICAVLDLFARRAIGYRIGKTNSTQLVKSTFRAAYESRCPTQPLTFHTDRGANYTSKTFCDYLQSLGVSQSFPRAHVPYDNSVMESFFSNLKREELYRTKYRSENEFRAAVDQYIIFYNELRPHAKNRYKTPARMELVFYSKQAGLDGMVN